MAIRPIESGQRSETVRRANLGTILRELHIHGPSTRSQLVARTGLTRSAIRRLVGELESWGLVREDAALPLGTPGRPSPLVHPDPRGAVVLALEIEVDSLAVATVGLGGAVLQLDRVDRSRGRSFPEQIVDDLMSLASSHASRWPGGERLAGVGAAVVGVVRRSDGFVSMAPNLGWRDVPLGRRLSSAIHARFGRDLPVAVANEADLGALAEHRRGAAASSDDVLFLSGAVGVGGGLISAGKPLVGAAGYSGEVGHIPVNPVTGVACRCGSVGCWETEVAAAALLARAGRSAGGGRAAVHAVLADAAAGSPRAVDALVETGRWLGIGLAGLVNVLDPTLIVLGGRFTELYPFVAPTIEAELDRRALPAPRQLVRVVPAALGVDAALLGAAELAFEPVLSDPAAWSGHRGVLESRASA